MFLMCCLLERKSWTAVYTVAFVSFLCRRRLLCDSSWRTDNLICHLIDILNLLYLLSHVLTAKLSRYNTLLTNGHRKHGRRMTMVTLESAVLQICTQWEGYIKISVFILSKQTVRNTYVTIEIFILQFLHQPNIIFRS